MAFEGNIEDFGVADILQLINSQGKTGALTFNKNKETISIGFENGMISSAFHNKKGVLKPIGDYLVLTGKISREKLKKLTRKSRRKGVALVDTLVENNILTREDLERIIEFKIQEVVDELFTWKKGDYKFQLGEKLYSKSKYSVLVNPQYLILEGIRRIDEWPKIEEAIPDSKIVFKKKKKPGLSVEIGDQEKVVLALINGKMSVEDIVESSGLGKFRTYHAIFNLLEGEVIEKTDYVVEPRKKKKLKIKVTAENVVNIVSWVIVILFLVANLVTGFYFRPFYRLNRGKYLSTSRHVENYNNYKLEELKKVYQIFKGKNDIRTEDLRRDGWIR
jgi:hypothetical protein